MRILARGAATVALAAATLVAAAPPAAAHADLLEALPGEGEVVEVLDVIVLVFNDRARPVGPGVLLEGPAGVVPVAVTRADDGHTVVAEVVGETVPGPHTAEWRVSTSDGHSLSGTLSFELLPPAAPPPQDAGLQPAGARAPAPEHTTVEAAAAPIAPHPDPVPAPAQPELAAMHAAPDAVPPVGTVLLLALLAAIGAGAAGTVAARRPIPVRTPPEEHTHVPS